MIFSHFAQFLEKLETTSSRNDVTVLLAEFFGELSADEIKPAMYLMQGRLVPTFVDLEFNVSQKLGLKALGMMVDDQDRAADLFKQLGDVGLVAEELVSADDSNQAINDVYAKLKEIAEYEGKGSQDAKVQGVVDLLGQLDKLGARYAMRVIIGKLRLGVSDKTVLDALSWFVTGDKSLRSEIERSYGARADIGELVEIVISTGKDQDKLMQRLAEVKLQPGTPVASKLVEREKDSAKTFERVGTCIVQPKLDGMRAQVHYQRQPEVKEVFSRNMESLTNSFPDLLQAVAELGVDSIILDSEVVGYDFENDTYLSYQETMTRRRKHDVDATIESLPVKSMAFDVLYLNGEDLTQIPVEERVAKLKSILESSDQHTIELLDSPTLDSVDKLDAYFKEKIGQGLEGVIAKKLGTSYDPGTRNFDWIKLKANTQSELVDTVDVVVIGYYTGRGERAKYGIGAFLTAVPDADGGYYSVAKVGGGIKDEQWPQILADIKDLRVDEQPADVHVVNQLKPDTWLKPGIVIEVDADEITRSPAHTAAANIKADFEPDTKGRGLSLRFPRLKVWNRDKKPEDATSAKELVRMYELRKSPS